MIYTLYILMGISCILGALLITMRYATVSWWDAIKAVFSIAGVIGLFIAGGLFITAGLGG